MPTPHELPDLSLFRHSTPVQIRFNDVDILGHVNNTVYFSFYDTGKAYYFQDVRKGQMEWRRVETIIANINCTYVKPIFFGNNIEVHTRCISIGEKSFRLQQVITDDKKEIRSVCETVMVSFNPENNTATPLPDYWREAFEDYEKKPLSQTK